MSFILTLLARYNTILEYVAEKRIQAASYVRRYLGPEPQNMYVLQDGRILPTSIELPASVLSTSYMFDIQNNHLTKMDGSLPGRYRPLFIIALQFIHPDIGTIDISEWIGEIRIFPTHDISARQLIDLWGALHNRYVPLQDTRITITRNDGSVETI
jgi:hypothetical protein